MIKDFNQLINLTRNAPIKKEIIVVGAEDAHTLEGVFRASEEGIVRPILLGRKDKILEIIEKKEFDFKKYQVVDHREKETLGKVAVEMIKNGQGDFLMKGMMQTAEFLKPVVNYESGLYEGGLMSHMGLFQIPNYHKLIGLTDGGMVIKPNREEKVQLIKNSVEVFHCLGYDQPKVASLAATEVVNFQVEESVDGKWLREQNIPGCLVEGPISYDLALNKKVAEIKGYQSPVAGDADLLLAPNITAGNMLGKSWSVTLGGEMAGLVLGAKVPLILVSRGASSREKYLSIVLAVVASKGVKVKK